MDKTRVLLTESVSFFMESGVYRVQGGPSQRVEHVPRDGWDQGHVLADPAREDHEDELPAVRELEVGGVVADFVSRRTFPTPASA
jgi:hypothetical protein